MSHESMMHGAIEYDAIRRSVEDIVGIKHAISAESQGERPLAWIARPHSAHEVADLIRLCLTHDIAVAPFGASGRLGPELRTPDRHALFIDMRRMNQVLELDHNSLIVHVQAGIFAADLEEALAPHDLSIGDYPPSLLASTLGGLLAVRTPGKVTRRHGFLEDAVLGLSAVLADGRMIHTRVAPRRATGPDLGRMLCGSEGTLGIITSAVLRIHAVPERRLLAAFRTDTFSDALAAVYLALREEAAPTDLRVYDHNSAQVHLGADASTNDGAVLVAATGGPTDLAACDRDLLASAVAAVGGTPLPERVAATWWNRRTGVDPRALPPAPHLTVSATPSKQHIVYDSINKAARDLGCTANVHASRFDIDGGVLFVRLVDPSGAALEGDTLHEMTPLIAKAAQDAGAYLPGGGNPELEKYFARLRNILDPKGIMNPWALPAGRRAASAPEPDDE